MEHILTHAPKAPFLSREAAPLLRATGLRKLFGGQVVLDGIDLELQRGEVVLLRGENGSGKTTLLNILTGNIEPDSGEIRYGADDTPRTYRFPRRWWKELNPWDHFRPEFVALEGMGRTWQDIRIFRSLTLRDNIAVAEPRQPGENPVLALLAPSRARKLETRIRAEADVLLDRLGLAGREFSSADKVSLGQSKRVGIARAVSAGARILFLDEPIAGLDRQGIVDILDLLESLVRDRHLTLVIVEHVFNQHHLRSLITTSWLLENGKLRRNDVERVANSPSTKFEPSSRLAVRPAWVPLLGGEEAGVVDEFLPRGASLTRIRRPDRFRPEAPPVFEIRNLLVQRGSRLVIGVSDDDSPGFSLTLQEGEIAVLQAPNGWGKSTLFAALCGLIDIAQGEIILKGWPIQHLPTWDRVRKGLTALPSDQNTFSGLTTRESLKLAGNGEMIGEFGSLADRACSSLSGGERQRVALASTSRGHIQLLDEPFSGLDQAAAARAASLILTWPCSSLLIAIPSPSR